MDIVEFLTLRLAEEAHVAQLAATENPPPWNNAHGGGMVQGGITRENSYIDGDLWDCESSGSLMMKSETAEHIARHDPSRVLADVAAKRAVMAEHYAPFVLGEQRRHCMGCGFDNEENMRTHEINRCPTLRALASTWSDHPDFDPAWRAEPATT